MNKQSCTQKKLNKTVDAQKEENGEEKTKPTHSDIQGNRSIPIFSASSGYPSIGVTALSTKAIWELSLMHKVLDWTGPASTGAEQYVLSMFSLAEEVKFSLRTGVKMHA